MTNTVEGRVYHERGGNYRRILDLVKKEKGGLRGPDIEKVLEMPQGSIASYLTTLMTDGILIGCKVITERNREVWHVRMSEAGEAGQPSTWQPLQPTRDAPIARDWRTGQLEALDESSEAIASDPAVPLPIIVPAQPAGIAPATATVPIEASAPAPAAPLPIIVPARPPELLPAVASVLPVKRFGLFSDGTLEVELNDGTRTSIDRTQMSRLQALMRAADSLAQAAEAA